MTQPNLTPEWAELDQIDAAHEAAETVEDYMAQDARYFEINPDIRRAWLDSELRAVGVPDFD